MIKQADWVLNFGITGYHQYILEHPIHLEFASQNLCDILGVEKASLLCDDKDLYLDFVHPADKEKYSAFINNLCNECTDNIEYRLITKNGKIIHVTDTVTVLKDDEGALKGTSVLTDISATILGTETLQFLNDTVSCGFFKCTCDKQPKITYINDRMLEMLGFNSGKDADEENLDIYKSNIFMMIPIDERRQFSHYLNRVYAYGAPLAGEINIQRFDGGRSVFFGLVTKSLNEFGEEEFQSICIDVSQRYHEKKQSEISRYLKALTEVYDIIFEYDLAGNTVKCIHAKNSATFSSLINLPMQMRESTEGWIKQSVFFEDREIFSKYFQDFFNKKQDDETDYKQIKYRSYSKNGNLNTYVGLLLKISNSTSLFCCRKLREPEDSAPLKSEIVSLKNLQEMVMSYSDGIAAFEIADDFVKPLYVSDNVSHFFGYTQEEWLTIMKDGMPLKDFIAHSRISYEQIVEMFKNGQGEFTYYDLESEKEKKIRAICSQRISDTTTTRYVMLYDTVDKGHVPDTNVSIRTFGYFDIFVFGKPIAFRSEKSKELLALLVDRKGGFISSEEAISFLWPDEPANPVTMSRYRKVALRLKNNLSEYGVSNIIESVDGKRRIIPENVQCDLYEYLTGKEEFSQNFKGNYLTNYSWGEETLGELLGENIMYH